MGEWRVFGSDIFGPKMGTYSLESKSDPRFNCSWRKEGLVCWGLPDWLKKEITNKVKELGLEKYPEDLTYSFWKD